MPFRIDERGGFADWEPGHVPGVYGVLGAMGRIVYVGQTGNLGKRLARHRSDSDHCIHRHRPGAVIFERVAQKTARQQREAALIAELDPPCNRT